MIGSKVYVGEDLATLKDLTWGIDKDGLVQVAFVAFEAKNGSIQTVASPLAFGTLTRRVEDLEGYLFRFEGFDEARRVDSIEYAIDADGHLGVAYLDCDDLDGGRRVIDNLLGFACCRLGSALTCFGSACTVPNICSGTPGNCSCSSGANCSTIVIIGCRGGCPGGSSECTGACTNNPAHCLCDKAVWSNGDLGTRRMETKWDKRATGAV